MKKIPAKIGWELILICILLFIFPILEWDREGFLVILATVFFILITIFSIRYYIDGHYFIIKAFLGRTIRISIHDIYKIEKTPNLIASPAPSIFGRVEIYYQKDSVVIAPKNFDEFKNELLKMNPNIEVKH